jgi:F0F1-type ATP synthase assembly protein I
MSFGAELCLVIGLFMLVGYFLDKKLGNPSPDLMILGFFIGLGTMVYIFIKRVQITQRDLDEMQNEEDEDDD